MPHGEQTAVIASAQRTPSTATGTWAISDCALVVTCKQLTTPSRAHASVRGDVKCTTVR